MAALRKPEVAKLPSVRAQLREGDAVRWLIEQIKVEFPGDAEIMTVSCTRNDPDEAQTLVKAVVDAYMVEIVNHEQDLRRERFSELERVLASYEQKLVTQKQTLRELTPDFPDGADKEKSRPPSVDMQMIQLEIKTLEKMVGEVRMELERQKIELRARPRVTQLGLVEKPLMPD